MVWGAVAAPGPGLTGFGAPGFGGAALALAAGCAGLGAPAFAGVALALGAGCAGFGVAALWGAALVPAAGCAGFGAPLFCGAVLALRAGFAGFGAAELSALDPLEGELDGFAAGLGALEPPELDPEPFEEELAGFGATCAPLSPPDPPEGPPATLATGRTATDEGDTDTAVTEMAVMAFAGDSNVPSSHTRAAQPSSTDTDPARHIRDSAAASTRAGNARDTADTGTGGTAQLRRPPAEVTDTITNAPRVLPTPDTATVRFRCSPAYNTIEGDSTGQRRHAWRFHKGGFRGSKAPSSNRIASRGHVTRWPAPSAEHSGTSALAPATNDQAQPKSTAASDRRNPASGNPATEIRRERGAE